MSDLTEKVARTISDVGQINMYDHILVKWETMCGDSRKEYIAVAESAIETVLDELVSDSTVDAANKAIHDCEMPLTFTDSRTKAKRALQVASNKLREGL